ncbi:HipA domain-containing protein [Sorangium sp. So ce295]|jgi:serine/threonine-protein kinase HipA|uniref:type II toxin-antitoxin system HipA family toxin n=1 Tax=Sorangium sp. So ce295 TaxID=3133295 RepID=UPI003F600A2B
MRLRVLLRDASVGMIERHQDGRVVFRFDEAYLALSERPVLGRWFEDHLAPPLEYAGQSGRLPPFFQNYLPEEESALRTLLARKAGVRENQELSLLAVLGGDLPGAVVVRAEDPAAGGAQLDEPAPSSPAEDDTLRFSLAGMQLKFSVLQQETRFTLPVAGQGGRWIVKLPDRRYPRVPENEYSMLAWARETGISVPDFNLVQVSDIQGLPEELRFDETLALAIRRFDRNEQGARIHQEDFAQVLNVRPRDKYKGHNYATIANIVRNVSGEADYEELVRRLVFVVLSGNADAHLKNWSLVYPDGRRARLSPAYDLVSTIAYGPGLDQRLALRLSGEKEFSRVTRAHFERLAERIKASPALTSDIVSETALRARDAWSTLRGSLPIAPGAREELERHLNTIPL